MNQSPERALAGLADALSVLAQTLYEAEASPDLVFVRAQAEAAGVSSPAATRVVGLLAALWEQYPLAKDVVERLGEAVAAGRHDEVAQLLGPDAVRLPDGTTRFVGALIDDLQARVEVVVKDGGRLAEDARTALARLDGAATKVRELSARAAQIGAADDVEIVAATDALGRATAALAADPTDAGPIAAVDRAVTVAATRVQTLERAQQGFPASMAAARADLVDMRRLIAAGAAGADLARAKITHPSGLLDPLDPSAVEGPGDQALAPWFDRIEAQAQAGGWQSAATELERWRRAADSVLDDARRVASANGAAIARRNELRGLLQAFRAKSLAMGRAEDDALVALHSAAEQALHVAPCDLSRAERLVGDYLQAVNTAVPGSRR